MLTHSRRSSFIILERTVRLDAPIDTVFEFWKDFRNFPRFMSYVRDVTINEEGGIHWTLDGPAGIAVEWDARVERLVTNQEISWRSAGRALVSNSGRVRFASEAGGHTWVGVHLTYALPAGRLGNALARLLGFDPRSRIDSDLRCMRQLIEARNTRRAAS